VGDRAETVLGWLLLEAAVIVDAAAKRLPPDQAFYAGKKFSAQYFAANVLPLVAAKAALLGREDRTPIDMPQAAFATI
jgi:hypothetical protein